MNYKKKQFLTHEEAAEYLQVPKGTLYNWISMNCGPKRVKMGRKNFYRVGDLDLFIEERIVEANKDKHVKVS